MRTMKASLTLISLLAAGSDAFAPSSASRSVQQHDGATSTSTLFSSSTSSVSTSGVEQGTAAEFFAGAGPIKVDMNKYNLGLEASSEEWTARLSAEL